MWNSLGKPSILRCQMRSGNLDRGPTGGLDPPPSGERECMDFLRKTVDSEVSDEVRQSRRLEDLVLRSTPIRRARMYGFPEENRRF